MKDAESSLIYARNKREALKFFREIESKGSRIVDFEPVEVVGIVKIRKGLYKICYKFKCR